MAITRQESGFTLIELLIVLVIIGILMAIAIPAYKGFKNRAADATAKSQLRAAAVAATAYAFDNSGVAGDVDNSAATSGFQGMTNARLRLYDRGIKAALTPTGLTQTTYCLRITVTGYVARNWSIRGPAIAASAFKNNLTCA